MTTRSKRLISERTIQTRIAVAQEATQAALEAANLADGAGAYSVTYLFPAQDFGAGNITEVIAGAPGFRGKVKNVTIFNVTEVFNAVTTPARVDVGITAGDLDAYAISGSLGTTGVGASASPAITDGVIGTIPVGEDLTITSIAPTGGTPTGIADMQVTIQYFL